MEQLVGGKSVIITSKQHQHYLWPLNQINLEDNGYPIHTLTDHWDFFVVARITSHMSLANECTIIYNILTRVVVTCLSVIYLKLIHLVRLYKICRTHVL